ncbi:hypothetical protein GCM10023257_73220 [Streptomyces hyderabadensis]|uniref:Translation initiation factor IF-2 n=1 Tax=Streptomyces hyderabadensis TaxID=598549 RepID=A0ABP9IZ82_9ACTN
MGAGSADECSESYAHPEVFRGGKCARVKNWQKDAQPEWPEAESGAPDRSEAGRDADATEVLPPAGPLPSAGEPPVTAPGSGWFGDSGAGPRGRGSSDAGRTEGPGSRIGGRAPRQPSPDPLARGRITWGTPAAPPAADPGPTAPIPNSFDPSPRTSRIPGNSEARDSAPGTGPGRGVDTGPDFDRTAVLPPTGGGAPGAAAADARDSGSASGYARGSAPGRGYSRASVPGSRPDSDFDRTAVLPPTGGGATGPAAAGVRDSAPGTGPGRGAGSGPDFDRTAVLPPTGGGVPGPAVGDARDSGSASGYTPGTGYTRASVPGSRPDPGFDRTAVLPPTGGGAPGAAAADARDFGPGTGPGRGAGSGGDFERTAVLPPAGAGASGAPTRVFSGPGEDPASPLPSGPATAALRDPWQETPEADAGHTHDPHEVTVQLDAVHLGDGVLLRADGGHRKSGPEASDGPVFVDASGRRNRLYRRLGILVAVACAVYAVVIVSTLLSGNSDAPWMPVPGQEEGAPAGQVDTTPQPSQSAQPTGTGTTAPQATPSAGAGATTEPGVESPASGTSGVTGGATGQPGTSAAPKTSAPGTDQNQGGGATGPDPTQSTQVPPPDSTDPSAPTGGDGTSVEPTAPTGGSTTGTDPGTGGGTNANGAGAPDPLAGQGGAPVVVAGPADTSTSPHLSPENTL